MTIDAIMKMAPVIPVLVIDEAIDPIALAETLVETGLPVIEVTLRTANALDAIRAMGSVTGAIVGAGTVLNSVDLNKSMEAGAKFLVSPGLTEGMCKAAIDNGIPYLPGVATASDLMRGLQMGLDRFKFFPAEAAGGLRALNALAGPFGQVRFCPTGGIRPDTAPEWLAHPLVSCVGGSWLVPSGESDLDAIADRARAAAGLRRRSPGA